MNIKNIIREEVYHKHESDALFINGYLKDITKLTKDYGDKFESLGDIESAELMRDKAYGVSTIVSDYINTH